MSKVAVDAETLCALRKRAANLDAFADMACEWATQAEIAIAASRHEVAALKLALRDVAICEYAEDVRETSHCRMCGSQWARWKGFAESHHSGCLAALVEGTTAGERTP